MAEPGAAARPRLTPEEDAIGGDDDADDEIDSDLPADLWFGAPTPRWERPLPGRSRRQMPGDSGGRPVY